MKSKYIGFEIHYPSKSPTENGEYFGKSPNFKQAINAARAIRGSLYGITADGKLVPIWY